MVGGAVLAGPGGRGGDPGQNPGGLVRVGHPLLRYDPTQGALIIADIITDYY